jgi:predicted dehydrogenase
MKTPPLRFGVLGCANIARQFIRDCQSSPDVTITTVASRQLATAQAFAHETGIKQALGSYEALLAESNLDAIYIPLPNSLHAEWAIKALRAGKHVLCEKPLALNAQEVRAMFAAARAAGRYLLEAYPYWFQPQTGDMLDLVAEGQIGDILAVHAHIGFKLAQPKGNIRFNPDLGGGALLDAGSYPVSMVRLMMGSAPDEVMAWSNWTEEGVDLNTQGLLRWKDGRRAQISCAMDVGNIRRAVIMGSAGVIETEYLNHTSPDYEHPWGYQPGELRIRPGIAGTLPFETVISGSGSGFRFAAEAFAKVVREKDGAAIERAAAASLDIAKTLEALGRSARLGQSVQL